MPTSASFLRNRRACSGYTLLEMVVVLAILALATSMVAPATFRMIQSWREATGVRQVRQALAALPWTVQKQGQELRLPPPGEQDPGAPADASLPGVDLPEGWSIELKSPLIVRANGACNDADMVLTTRRQKIALKVLAPFCQVTEATQGPQVP